MKSEKLIAGQKKKPLRKESALWREDFNEGSTLLCALDRIFDEATVFKLRGESFRRKKPDECSARDCAV